MVARRFALPAAVALVLVTSWGTDATASHYQTATVKMHAPVGSTGGQAWMNCGWHDSCRDQYDDGPGVDWWPETSGKTCCGTGRNVYFRSWNYMGATEKIGTIKIYNYQSATCYEARVDIRDQGGAGSIAGKVIYQHSSRAGDTIWVSLNASPSGTYSGNHLASKMVTAEKPACGFPLWTGTHLHEKHANGFASFVKNVGSPPGAIQLAKSCTPKPCKALYSAPSSSSSVWSRSVSFTVYICANDPDC